MKEGISQAHIESWKKNIKSNEVESESDNTCDGSDGSYEDFESKADTSSRSSLLSSQSCRITRSSKSWSSPSDDQYGHMNFSR